MITAGRYDLHHAILNSGGYLEVGFMLGRKTMREGREPLIKDKKELLEELRAFMKYQQRERLRTDRVLQQQQEQSGDGATDMALRGDPKEGARVDNVKSDMPGMVCLEDVLLVIGCMSD